MRGDVIARDAVRPALERTLNIIMQDLRYGDPMKPMHERLRRYGEMLGTAINEIPSAGINEVTVLPKDIGNVCGALAKAGYVVTTDKSGTISYEREEIA